MGEKREIRAENLFVFRFQALIRERRIASPPATSRSGIARKVSPRRRPAAASWPAGSPGQAAQAQGHEKPYPARDKSDGEAKTARDHGLSEPDPAYRSRP